MSSLPSKTPPSLRGRLTGIIVLFVVTIIGMLVHTFLTFQNLKSDAIVIDLAGRQRMLHQQHMKQILLVSRGLVADYHYTRQILNSTLEALLYGGSAVSVLGETETVKLPSTPPSVIRQKLSEQKLLIGEFSGKADVFLETPRGDPAYSLRLAELLDLSAGLHRTSNEAVQLFDQASRSKIFAMIAWETGVALFVGLFGLLLTRQVMRANRELENQIAERKKAQDETHRTQTTMSSIVENLPDMIFVKDARNHRFVSMNRTGEELLGYSREELVGKNDYDFFPRQEADFFWEKDREVLDGGKLVDIPEEPIKTRYKGFRFLHTKKVPILASDGTPEYLLGISEDITEHREAEEQKKAYQNLLSAISLLQSEFIAEFDPRIFFDNMLSRLLALCQSSYGFIGEILENPEGKPYLRTYAISDIAWNDETRALYASQAPNLEFYNLNNLFGAVITTGKPVIANDPWKDPRRGGVPHGHPPLDSFLGVPFHKGGKMVGMVGVANRPGGYDQEVVGYLEPFLATCGNIIDAYRNYQQRQRAEQQLRESETQFRQVVEHIREVFWLTNPQKNQMLYISPAYEEIWGRTRESLYASPLSWTEAIHPADRDRIREAAATKQLAGEYDVEYRVVRPDGSIRWIWDRAYPVRDEAGNVYRLAGTAEDITERKQAETALQAIVRDTAEATGSEFFRSLVRSLAASLDVRYAFVSEFADGARTRVRTLAFWMGRGFGENIEYDIAHTPCEAVLAGEVSFWPNNVQRHFPRDLDLVKLGAESYLAVPIFDSEKEVIGHGVVMDDQPMADRPFARAIMELVALRASAELQRSRSEEALRRSEARRLKAVLHSDGLKSALLSSVSHELRTPLTAIKSMAAGLSGHGGKKSEAIREEFIEGIQEEIDYLNRLVDNLLDMSRIEAGTLEPRREWHPLEDLLEGAIRRTGKALRERPFELNVADDLPTIFADGVEIQQVLVNLLDNAIKYSPSKSPIRLGADAKDGQVEVRVSNRGLGIPGEDLQRVFDRFYRVRMQGELSKPGTGLGLAICKGIVEAHGGRIWAESKPDQETTFAFMLPLGSQPVPALEIDAPRKEGGR